MIEIIQTAHNVWSPDPEMKLLPSMNWSITFWTDSCISGGASLSWMTWTSSVTTVSGWPSRSTCCVRISLENTTLEKYKYRLDEKNLPEILIEPIKSQILLLVDKRKRYGITINNVNLLTETIPVHLDHLPNSTLVLSISKNKINNLYTNFFSTLAH